ncbi:MAG: glycosyltransferase family 2 protein [Anaerolineae bacterium]
MEPEVSIILLTKNGGRYIEEVLEAILRQVAACPHEVILIDSDSTDGTWEIATSFPIRTHRIEPEEFNHGETRNLGARMACPRSSYLVYLTQDATPLENWLDNLLQPLRADPEVAGAFSRHVPRPTCAPSMARLMRTEWQQSGTSGRVVKRIDDPREYERNRAYYAYFSNTSSAIRRSVWEAYPFQPLEFAEDAEWADRVLRAGYTLVYEPSSRVLHSHDYSLWQQFAQNVDHARAIKEILGPPESTNARPGRVLRHLGEQTLKDWRYISATAAGPARKARWALHAPLWQLATEMGIQVGSHAGKLPAWLLRRLSRQATVRG